MCLSGMRTTLQSKLHDLLFSLLSNKVSKVQSGDWCSKIEGDIGLASGQLITLNPGLSCDAVFPNQNLCVEPPLNVTTNDTKNFTSWKKYPVLSAGDLPKSPLVSFVNANVSRETFFGDMIFKRTLRVILYLSYR